MEMSFDQQSLAAIHQMYGFNVLLAPETQAAMGEIGDLLVQKSVANTWAKFMHPSGRLAATIHKVVDSPYEIRVAADSAYAHRREFSFKGPNVRGILTPNDPAAYYMTDSLNEVSGSGEGLGLLQDGVSAALMRLGDA